MNLSNVEYLPDTTGIYKIKNLTNNKFYIGSTEVSFRDRAMDHRWGLRGDYHKNRHLQNSYNKYGEKSFNFIIVNTIPNTDNIRDVEQNYLDNINWDQSYNINRNADRVEVTEELKEYRSQYMKEKWQDPEWREMMCKKNQDPWNKGEDNPFSEETIQKMSESAKNRDNQEYVTKRLRETRKENANRVKVKYVDGEEVGVFKSAQKIYELSKNGYFDLKEEHLRFKSGPRASEKLQPVSIRGVCNGNKDSYKGFVFEYVEQQNG